MDRHGAMSGKGKTTEKLRNCSSVSTCKIMSVCVFKINIYAINVHFFLLLFLNSFYIFVSPLFKVCV